MHEVKCTASCIVLLARGSIGEYTKVLNRFAKVKDYAFGGGEIAGCKNRYMWIARTGVDWKAGDCEG